MENQYHINIIIDVLWQGVRARSKRTTFYRILRTQQYQPIPRQSADQPDSKTIEVSGWGRGQRVQFSTKGAKLPNTNSLEQSNRRCNQVQIAKRRPRKSAQTSTWEQYQYISRLYFSIFYLNFASM